MSNHRTALSVSRLHQYMAITADYSRTALSVSRLHGYHGGLLKNSIISIKTKYGYHCISVSRQITQWTNIETNKICIILIIDFRWNKGLRLVSIKERERERERERARRGGWKSTCLFSLCLPAVHHLEAFTSFNAFYGEVWLTDLGPCCSLSMDHCNGCVMPREKNQ